MHIIFTTYFWIRNLTLMINFAVFWLNTLYSIINVESRFQVLPPFNVYWLNIGYVVKSPSTFINFTNFALFPFSSRLPLVIRKLKVLKVFCWIFLTFSWLCFTELQKCGHAISPQLHTYPTTFSRNFCRKHHHNRRQREKTRMKMLFLTIRVHKAGFWGVVFIS